MKIKTLVIAPYPGLKELALQLAHDQHDLEILVEHGDLREALPIVKRYESKGIQFIVSRGGTAKLIREYTTIPVVEIQVSGYDILRALTLVKDYKIKVEIIGFPNVVQGVVSVAHLLQIDLPITTLHRQDEVETAVQLAKANGVQVVLGDTITISTAAKYGLQGMMITSGRESVLEAFEHVRQIHRMLQPLEHSLTAYQQMLNVISDGWVRVHEEGKIAEQNAAFEDMFNLPTDAKDASLADILPGLSKVLQQKLKSQSGDEQFTEHFTFNQQLLQVTGGRFDGQSCCLLFRRIAPKQAEKTIKVRKIQDVTASFAQIVANSPVMQKTIQEAKKLAQSVKQPVMIYGEKGAGKKFVAAAIHYERHTNEAPFIEIIIPKSPEVNSDIFEEMVSIHDTATYMIKGIENLPLPEQQRAAAMMNRRAAAQSLMLLFDDPPQELVEQGELHPDVMAITDHILRIPSLRERKEDLHEYIRLLIGIYNSRFGKQVVGVRDEVFHYLLHYEWRENMAELKRIVKELVRTAQGYYIEENQLHLLPEHNEIVANKEPLINLHGTLNEIEKEIIGYVLKEENMNQTKAAERLGINRSTLWRKLNEK